MVALLFPRTIGKVKIFFQDKNSLGLIFLRSVNPEFERKVDFQNRTFGWMFSDRFQNLFF